jgi:hypothetical protein
MTITHFGTVNVAELPVTVNIGTVFCSISSTGIAEATINARTIGDVTCRRNGAITIDHDWIDPKFEAPGSPPYQIRRTDTIENNVDLNSDPGFGPFEGVWQDVGVLAFWGFQIAGGFASANFDVSIRQGPSGPVLDVGRWWISTQGF